MLKTALSYFGLREIPGEKNNPEILKFFHEIGHKWVQTDETAWCAAFVNYCAKVSGREHTGKLNARSFLDIGMEVTEPVPGDVVVFWRESKNSWKGHVGLFIAERDGLIYALGGNQQNQVNILAYPEIRVLGYRRLGLNHRNDGNKSVL